MGSYDIVCAISDLPIHCGDDCVMIPITRTKGGRGGVFHEWFPVGFPVYGYYDDYGTIEIDDNQSLYWDIYKTIHDKTPDQLLHEHADLVMPVHRDVFEFMTTGLRGEWGRESWQDAEDVINKCAKVTIKAVKRETESKNVYVDAYERFITKEDDDDKRQELIERLKEINERSIERSVMVMEPDSFHRLFGYELSNINCFNGFLAEHFEEEELLEEIVRFAQFIFNCVAVNKTFRPVYLGFQHGNDYASSDLAVLIAKKAYSRMQKVTKELLDDDYDPPFDPPEGCEL